MQKKSNAKRAIRAEGQTQISISLSKDILRVIEDGCAAEHRSRSNYIRNAILRYGDAQKSK